jgi:uncharacterized protein
LEMSANIVVLCAFAFFASIVDAVAGGGGLISVPALLIFLPGAPPPLVLGTNKFASTCGASAAAARYALNKKIVWSVAVPAGVAAFGFAIMGARTVTLLDKSLVRPIILALLVGVAAYTLLKPEHGEVHKPKLAPKRSLVLSVTLGSGLGFYEGFFGPGTGSFLLFAFVALYGFDYIAASATGRLVNLSANVAALMYFMAAGFVRYDIALPMAACTVLGGWIGSRFALQYGGKFIRALFLIVVAILLAKLGWDTLAGISH